MLHSRPFINLALKRLFPSMANEPPAGALVVPEGFTLHTENTSSILLPTDNGAFLNPVQEFNRDLSVACINTWGELMNEEKRRKAEAASAHKKAKKQKSASVLLCGARRG